MKNTLSYTNSRDQDSAKEIHHVNPDQKDENFISFNKLFLNSLKIGKEFFESLTRKDEDIEEMIEQYKKKYLDMGVKILSASFFLSFFFIAMVMYALTEPSDPYRWRVVNLGIMHSFVFILLKFIQTKFPYYLKHSIALCLMSIMVSITNGNMKEKYYKIYEPMFFYV
jgi:hypothetical protein